MTVSPQTIDHSTLSTLVEAGAVRADTSARLKHAHESAAYDTWLREKVGASLAGLQDGSNPVIPPTEWEQVREQKRRAS